MFKISRFIIFLYINLVYFSLVFLYQYNDGFQNITLKAIIVTYVVTMISYFFIVIWYEFICNLGRFLYWMKNKKPPIALVFYPFLINFSTSFKLNLIWDPFDCYKSFFPMDIYSRIQTEKQLKEFDTQLIDSEKTGFIFRIVFSVILCIILLICHQPYYAIFICLNMLNHYILENINENYYHGTLTRIKYIKKGYSIFYIANQAILYEGDKSFVYKIFQKQLLHFDNPKFEFSIIKTLKHIFMERIFDNSIKIMPNANEFIFTQILEPEDFVFGSMNGAESWDFVKIYMSHAMLMKDENQLAKIIYTMHLIRDSTYPRLRDLVDWYISIGQYNRILPQESLYKNKVIRKDGFNVFFPAYRKQYEWIKREVELQCTKY